MSHYLKKAGGWGAAPYLIGGGLMTVGAVWYASRKSKQTTDAVTEAVNSPQVTPGGVLPSVNVHLTGYWPFISSLSAKDRLMEGGLKDRKGNPLHTLEMHLKDPVAHPYVSVAGDDAIWPYGQRLIISAWPKATFRVVDTGGHFRGANKLYRVMGEEPLDICVDSSKTVVPKKGITAQVVPGDHFAKSGSVAYGKMQGQTVSAGDGAIEGRTIEDREALARAIESELSGRPDEELEAAAWAMRNRADSYGSTVYQMLAPKGIYDAPARSGGYASTRKVATDRSRAIASKVLDATTYDDPTEGSIDFWVPSLQSKMCQLGDVHRAAIVAGDVTKALKFAKYANYKSEGDVRNLHAKHGLQVSNVIGAVELLRRRS